MKYADDGKGTIHFIATEDHPRNFDNSLYHGYVRDGAMYKTDGTKVSALSTTTEATNATWDFTKVYQGTPDSVAWMVDVELDSSDRPYVLFSTQVDGRGLPRGQGGMDLRYHYARLGASGWRHEEIAYAGTRLYPSEDDYSGLGALDPNNPDVLYISTDADPVTGAPLISTADNKRHYELFRGERSAAGKWTFTPFTRNSAYDNLRPLIPKWNDRRTAIVWMRGALRGESGRVVFVGRRGDRAAARERSDGGSVTRRNGETETNGGEATGCKRPRAGITKVCTSIAAVAGPLSSNAFLRSLRSSFSCKPLPP